jgi:hypothetical protein
VEDLMKKLFITLFMAVLGLAFLGLMAGCPPSSSDDDDAGDDDAGDDDAGDDDMGDDDMADDDAGDDDTWPDSPYGFHISVSFNASGASSTTTFEHIMIDANQNDLCSVVFDFPGTTATGPGQGDDYYQYIDEVVEWTSGTEASNNCPADWAIYKGDPVEWFMWYMHPLAFVSCDLVAQVGGLASTFLGDDAFDLGSDGTFGGYCNDFGPALQSALGSGPIEAMWLSPGTDGSLDGLGNYAYFAPADTTNVAVWLAMGALMADAANTNEPTDGLNGDYVTVPFWLWVYSG